MFRLSIFLAGVWGSAGSVAYNLDLGLIQMSASANQTAGALSQSDEFEFATTPNPTFAPGIPCECLPRACFAAYDLNNDSCLTQDECDLQTPLEGCWTNHPPQDPPYDHNSDGCINISEFLILNLSLLCPVSPPPPPCSCPEGEYISGFNEDSECVCTICDGSARRRRSLSCDTCEPGRIHIPNDDDCVCTAEPFLMEDHPIGSTVLDVQVTNPLGYVVGDNVTIITRMSGRVAENQGNVTVCEGGGECRNISLETAIITEMRGSDFVISPPLNHSYIKYDPIMLTCTSMDGSDSSRKYTASCAGGFACQCGLVTCTKYELCDCSPTPDKPETYPHGCVCTPAGPYPDHPTPAPTVGAKGDPHLVNIQGEHFDINHGGEYTLLRLPQSTEKPAELELKATVRPEFEHPCTTYITQVEIFGSWLGNTTAQVRCYLKDHPGSVIGTYLGARLLSKGDDPRKAEWDSIEAFLQDTPELVLSAPDSQMEVTMSKSQWFPRKEITAGVPTVAGMFTVSVRKSRKGTGSKFVIRQDLPEQQHLNLAVQKLSALGRADVGGLLGFDAHPEDLEMVSSHCHHYRATEKRRVESVDNNGHTGYSFKPAWKERWERMREEKANRGHQTEADEEVGAEASLLFGTGRMLVSSMMCKCPDDIGAFDEGVLIEEKSANLFAEASWD